MESSEMFGGGGEECHSSESGWTMYLGSSINGDEQESCFDDDDDACRNPKNYYLPGDGEDSDDSMASDASSGPTHHHFNLNNGGVDDDEHEDEDSTYSKKQMEIKNGRTRASKKGEEEHVARSKTRKSQSFSAPQNDSKVRKTTWMGKFN